MSPEPIRPTPMQPTAMRSLGGFAPNTELGMITGDAKAAPAPNAIELLRNSRRENVFAFLIRFTFIIFHLPFKQTIDY
jgi:hypothetical protein